MTVATITLERGVVCWTATWEQDGREVTVVDPHAGDVLAVAVAHVARLEPDEIHFKGLEALRR